MKKIIAIMLTASMLLLSVCVFAEAPEEHVHSYDAGVVIQEAGCTEDGVIVFTCVDGDDSYTETIPAKGHVWDEGTVIQEAGCTEDGAVVFTCVDDDDSYTETIPAKGHVWDEGTVLQEAGCETAGEIAYTCTVCNLMEIESIDPVGHSWDEGVVLVPAGCEVDGEYLYTCSVCGETFTETIPAAGHQYENGVCTVCGAGSVPETRAKIGDTYYTTLKDAVASADAGAYVELLESEAGEGIVIDKDITIDFGGNTYEVIDGLVGNEANQCLLLTEGANVTLRSGRITTSTAAKYLIQNYSSSLTLKDIELDARGSNAEYALSSNAGRVLLTGDTRIFANAGEGCWAVDVYGPVSLTADAEMTGKVLGAIRISEDAEVTLMGGTYAQDMSGYVAPEYFCIDNADGSFAVITLNGLFNATPVAQVGGISYNTLADAAAAAKAGTNKVITLLVGTSENLELPADCSLVIPSTCTYSGTVTAVSGYALQGPTVNSDGASVYCAVLRGALKSCSLEITENIGLRYKVKVSNEFDNPCLQVTAKGRTVTLTERTFLPEESDSVSKTYRFLYNELTPADMTENVHAKLISGFGNTEPIELDERDYSISLYCQNTYSRYGTTNPSLRTFLADMLAYGTAAQRYLNKDTDPMPDDPEWVSQYKSNTDAVSYSDLTYMAPLSDRAKIKSGSLNLGAYIYIMFKINSDKPTAQRIELYRGSSMVKSCFLSELTGPESGTDGYDCYTLLSDPIAPLGMDDIYTLCMYEGGMLLGRVTYSVRSYVNRSNAQTSAVAEMTQKMYNYGCSGKRYANKSICNSCDSVKVNRDSIDLTIGQSIQLFPIITPANAPQAVSWSSTDPAVASIDSKNYGLLTANQAGTTTITVTTNDPNHKTATCTVTVTEQPASGFTYEEETSGGGIAITGYDGNIAEVIENGVIEIPDVINGIPVTSIADEAFEGNTLIEEIIMPNSIEVIGVRAFANCTNLKSMTCYD